MRCECEKGKGKFPLQRSLKTRSALAVVDVGYGFGDKVLMMFSESLEDYIFAKMFITCRNDTILAGEQLSTNIFDKV